MITNKQGLFVYNKNNQHEIMKTLKEILQSQKAFFDSNVTKDYQFRLENLKKLREIIDIYENDFYEALKKDFNKSAYETYISEFVLIKKELNYAIRHLKKWMKPIRAPRNTFQFFAKVSYRYQPYGNTLIVAPWNYPLLLIFNPLVAAIAAGNTAIIKLSEFVPHTSKLMLEIFNKYFDEKYIYFIDNNKHSIEEMMSLKYDHIFFTGSSNVGKKVMQQAATHLTPVTLELGGKSPCIVDTNTDLEKAVKSFLFGKILNAGQTCIAPDYLIVHSYLYDAFIKELIKQIDDLNLNKSNMTHIINDQHLKRLEALLAKTPKEKIVYQKNNQGNYFHPVIIGDVAFNDEIMQEEIFGPVIPVMKYENLEHLLKELKNKERPLALYMFSNDRVITDKVFSTLEFGGGAINDTIIHIANSHTPFGGVGNSGMGNYHGYFGFKTFSYAKTILTKAGFDNNLRYRPYTEDKFRAIKKIFK